MQSIQLFLDYAKSNVRYLDMRYLIAMNPINKGITGIVFYNG